jgi:hypothetical protein
LELVGGGGEVLCGKLIYRSACTIKHGERPEGRGFASFSRIMYTYGKRGCNFLTRKEKLL